MFPMPQTNQSVWNQDCLPAAAKLMSSDPSQDHAPERDHLHIFDAIANNAERVSIDLAVRSDVLRARTGPGPA